MMKIFVNGEEYNTEELSLAYEDIVSFAGLAGTPSMTLHAKKGQYSMDKIVSPGDDVPVIEGMRFEVHHTGNA